MQITLELGGSDSVRRIRFPHPVAVDGNINTDPDRFFYPEALDPSLLRLDTALKAAGVRFIDIDEDESDLVRLFYPHSADGDYGVFEAEHLPQIIAAIAEYLGVPVAELEVERELTLTEQVAQDFAALISRVSQVADWEEARRCITVTSNDQARQVAELLAAEDWHCTPVVRWSDAQASFEFERLTLGLAARARLIVVRQDPEWQVEIQPVRDGNWYMVDRRFPSADAARQSPVYRDLEHMRPGVKYVPVLY